MLYKVLGVLELVLVRLIQCQTFKMPSLITLSITNSADLIMGLACLSSIWKTVGLLLLLPEGFKLVEPGKL
jgi:hypothetical protein